MNQRKFPWHVLPTKRRREFTEQFPWRVISTMELLRRRVRLSREVSVDVLRARGCVEVTVIGSTVSSFDKKREGCSYYKYPEGGYAHTEYEWCECPYTNGKEHGVAQYRNANGRIIRQRFFLNGHERY